MALSDLNNLDFSNIAGWPPVAKGLLVIILITVVGGAGYWFDIKDLWAQLENVRRDELGLKEEFIQKQTVVANLDDYRARLEELKVILAELVKQLPTGVEMPDLLEQISDTGRANGLDFQLFRPEKERRKEFLADVPISIKARATYHQFGAFISSIAALERIVTLENAKLVTRGSGNLDADELSIEATLQTYRYIGDEGQGNGSSS